MDGVTLARSDGGSGRDACSPLLECARVHQGNGAGPREPACVDPHRPPRGRWPCPRAELLEEARDAFLADGRLEEAAEAMLLIGELLWMRADPDAFALFGDAAALLEDSPPSPV